MGTNLIPQNSFGSPMRQGDTLPHILVVRVTGLFSGIHLWLDSVGVFAWRSGGPTSESVDSLSFAGEFR